MLLFNQSLTLISYLKKHQDKDFINESLIENKIMKIEYVKSFQDTIFCKNISLLEKAYKNYET